MNKNIFDPKQQENDLVAKTVVGLERISEAFKVLLWEKAKQLGLSPIQIQILLFVSNHKRELCKVSHLANEFNITKPTVSDAVRSLAMKQLISKDHSTQDSRSFAIQLTQSGKQIVTQTQHFASPMLNQLGGIAANDLEHLFTILSKLIYQLNQNGILTVQRTCYACNYYKPAGKHHFCNLLNKELKNTDIRLDCEEFEALQ